MNLDFNEIKTGQDFEELVVSYFKSLKEDKQILSVKVEPSGEGADGGRDILVTFTLTDGIDDFTRTWVVQCKFHQKSISPSKINDVNIPTLLHSYKASGYLLICRDGVTSKLSNMFEKLEKNCIFGHKYNFWTGSQFKRNFMRNKALLEQYFPEYYNSIKNN